MMNLLLNGFIADNRSSDKLRKQSHVHCKINQPIRRMDLSLIYIHDVTDRLKSEETDSKRHDDMQWRDRCSSCLIDRINQKICIFEEYKLTKIIDQCNTQQHSALCRISFHPDPCKKVYSDRNKHDPYPASFSIKIEQQRKQQKDSILHGCRNKSVNNQQNR